MAIAGLPFAPVGNTGYSPKYPLTISPSGITLPANSIMGANTDAVGTNITILSLPTGGGVNGYVTLPTSGSVYICGQYQTNA
jgi:hypothetical protein